MDIKAIIEKFSEVQNGLENKIKYLKTAYSKEEQLWDELEKLNIDFYLNEKAVNFLADSLQMVNNDNRLLMFDLQDIKRIYQLLVQYYPDNIQYQTDLITFVYNVLDDEDEALELLNNAVLKIDNKRAYLESMLNQIKR